MQFSNTFDIFFVFNLALVLLMDVDSTIFFIYIYKMLRLKDKLREIAKQMSTEVIFNYSSRKQQNVDINDQEVDHMPLINVIEIESGVFSLNPVVGSFKERYPNTQIQFLFKSEFDFSSDQNDCIVDRMKDLAKEFLMRYEDSALFEPLTDVPFNQVYRAFDDDTAGVEITLNVRELNSQGTCLPDYNCQ